MSRSIGWTGLLLLVAGLAMAALFHAATLLAVPMWARRTDAFARITAVTSVNAKVSIPLASTTLPFRDPAMAEEICRYDVTRMPLRMTILPFDDGFVSLGFHTRSGKTYYGLTLQSAASDPMTIVVAPPSDARPSPGRESPNPDDVVAVTTPEPEGYVTMAAPMDVAGTGLDRITCAPDLSR